MTLKDCNTCNKLSAYRTQVVCGRGNPHANIMIVGENPGVNEDREGTPFIGKSGSVLDKYLKAAGINRKKVFITNAVKCVTPNRKGSHKPTDEEINNCRRWIVREIEIIKPKLIIVFGTTAMHSLLNIKSGITNKIGTIELYNNIPVFITLHPASILHSPGRKMQFIDSVKILYKYIKDHRIYV